MRGTPSPPPLGGRPQRFIPARAGNTRRAEKRYAEVSVHPRACGEHFREVLDEVRVRGSSPRVRGTRILDFLTIHLPRFIPARAGNTACNLRPVARNLVHPRACGEHMSATVAMMSSYGSSPRVRGTRPRLSGRAWPSRFIPARAGNTEGLTCRQSPTAVHPRACGEHPNTASPSSRRCGSSPRVRGTPCLYVVRGPVDRFIPARAGNTLVGTVPAGLFPVHPRACGEHQNATRSM